MKRRSEYVLVVVALLVIATAIGLFIGNPFKKSNPGNPLAGREFYVDDTRKVSTQAKSYRNDGNQADADLLDKIARQPGTTWLNGPSDGDPEANFDIAEVARTSAAAHAQGKVAVYQLYAIPGRDACAGYSKAGFTTAQDYQRWIERIKHALQGEAVFSVEADAVAHTVQEGCMTEAEKQERYATLRQALRSLNNAPYVVATYLDAGHAEWLPDISQLAGPLQAAGVEYARGIAVNVSAFVATDTVTDWSSRLASSLGTNKGVLVDTSRNGQGVPPQGITGDGRWCNPAGRGLGPAPTTKTGKAGVDAYMYIKIIGESDGDCRGNPPAGTFKPELALALARNAKQ